MGENASDQFVSLLSVREGLAVVEVRDGDPDHSPALPNLAEEPDAETSQLIAKVAELIGDAAVAIVPGKTCTACGDTKALDDFHRKGTHGRDNRCKACKRKARCARYQQDPEGAAAAATEWKKKNRIRARVQRLKNYAAKRGRGVDGEPNGDKGDLTADEWEAILESYRDERGRYRCAYCGRRAGRINLQIDHVVALSKGGRNTRTNVVPACGECNAAKCDRDRRPLLPSPHLVVEERRPFLVTDDDLDAPDGATIEREDGWWTRSGDLWIPTHAPEPRDAVEPDHVPDEALSFP